MEPIPFIDAGSRRKERVPTAALFALTLVLASLAAFLALIRPPRAFPEETFFAVEAGSSAARAAEELASRGYIRSPFVFTSLVRVFGSGRGVVAGTYSFERKSSALSVAIRLIRGDYRLSLARVTIPEGFTRMQIAERFAAAIPSFDAARFMSLSDGKEGYLFPDTYLVMPSDTAETVLELMDANFEKKTAGFRQEAGAAGRRWSDIVTMASLIEREAKTDDERYMISGILWRRIAIGMPLQVDAAFGYILGKGSSELTSEDLKISSPYNTYANKGLPPGPIANPGLASIEAALYPQDSPYLYYLHGNDGVIRYAKTHDEHVANKARYIR